jgi:hypothetical protein
VDLDDVMARVRELPMRLQSLRVETRGWTDDHLSMLASERARRLLIRRAMPPETSGRRSQTHLRSWMEFGEHGWDPGFVDLWPQRWREEHEQMSAEGKASRFVSGRDGDSYWHGHGDDVTVTDARRLKTSLGSAWVVGRRWISRPARRDVLGVANGVLGRSVLRVRITPEPGVSLDMGPFYSGDMHEIVVDVSTGMTLAVTSLLNGTAFRHDEVTDFEVDAAIPTALTRAPEDAEEVPAGQGFRSVEEVATRAELLLLAPTWLPPEYSFQTGGVYRRDDIPDTTLVFSRDRHEFVSLYERPASHQPGDDAILWERVERGSRTVLISDRSDQVGERVAHTTLDGTWAIIYATLPAAQLLDIAFSLESVTP